MLRSRLLILFLLLTPLLGVTCRRAEGVAEDPLDAEAERLFIDYLRIDTSNPPGNESAGARYLLSIFQREGIEARLVGPDGARQGVYARMRSGSAEKALLLLHHIDVVPARAEQWSVPPFAGERKGGYIWGRGALDIKSLGIAEMMAMIDLQRSHTPLARDLIFLATPDEEAGGLSGCAAILSAHPELFSDVGYVINEGGANKTVVDRITTWGIEVDQKVPLWLELTTRGPSGHSAIPPPAPTALETMLDVLRDVKALTSPTQGKSDDASAIETLVITSMTSGTSINSLPDTAVARIDARVPPTGDTASLFARIQAAVNQRAEIRVLVKGERASASSADTPLFATLREELTRAERGSKVITITSAGTTDSRFFRAKGITAYGFSPFKMNYFDYGTIHGPDEKMRITFFREGVRLMRRVVRSFTSSRSGSAQKNKS